MTLSQEMIDERSVTKVMMGDVTVKGRHYQRH